jgi:hypothetical protein
VYSLGATLHALLRGEPPFKVPDGGSPMAVAMKIVSDEPPPLVGVPPALADVVERAMAKDPTARFPSAAAMRDALDGLPTTTSVVDDATRVVAAPVRDDRTAVAPAVAPVAPPPSPPPARRQPPSRSRGAGWAVALVALIVLGVIAALFATNGDDDDPAAATTTTTAVPTSETTAATVEETTTTEAPPETTVSEEEEPSSDLSPEDAAREYFALLDEGDIEAGWQRLTPRYQNESGGRDSYEGFWSSIESVEVLEASQGDDLTAVVTLRYTRDDGTSSEETNTIVFREQGGQLLIDGSS